MPGNETIRETVSVSGCLASWSLKPGALTPLTPFALEGFEAG
jgi:hypothetical protein